MSLWCMKNFVNLLWHEWCMKSQCNLNFSLFYSSSSSSILSLCFLLKQLLGIHLPKEWRTQEWFLELSILGFWLSMSFILVIPLSQEMWPSSSPSPSFSFQEKEMNHIFLLKLADDLSCEYFLVNLMYVKWFYYYCHLYAYAHWNLLSWWNMISRCLNSEPQHIFSDMVTMFLVY